MKLLILLKEDDTIEWYRFSEGGLSAAYGDDEPSYTLDMLKEPTHNYKP
ncbi:MAG: hypothetical protein ICV51_19805 [Flavisolibacter sp.]|nr:hypothetical protein [Flavisolibacter sp.]